MGELPLDYEPCGDCGFDHAYEPERAYDWHCKDAVLPCVDENLSMISLCEEV